MNFFKIGALINTMIGIAEAHDVTANIEGISIFVAKKDRSITVEVTGATPAKFTNETKAAMYAHEMIERFGG